jgi:uncharacterized membrane protein YjgN (DUF898 family)
MTEKRYDVIFKGELAPGFDREKVKQNLAEGLAISEEKAGRILSKPRVVLKRALGQERAKAHCLALRSMGLLAYLCVTHAEVPRALFPSGDQARGDKAATQEEELLKGPEERLPFTFHGKGGEYFRIWMANVLLTILTLGIYSAWAKVRRKQYFYGSTRLQGAAFEYLAEPVKILKGRLIVIGFFILYNFASRFIPLAAAVLGVILVFALPWLVVRSLAFNAHNSAIRNIRFRFSGTYGEAAKTFILWPFLALLTLGLLFPLVYYKQKRFIVTHTHYGTTRFSFRARPCDYYRIFIGAALFIVAGVTIAAVPGLLFPPLTALAVLVVYLFVFAFVAVKTSNLLFNATRVGRHRLEAFMEVKGYSLVVLTNTVATALTVGLFYPWARTRATRYKVEHLALIPSGDLDSFVAAEQQEVSAVGDEMSEFLDFDFGI